GTRDDELLVIDVERYAALVQQRAHGPVNGDNAALDGLEERAASMARSGHRANGRAHFRGTQPEGLVTTMHPLRFSPPRGSGGFPVSGPLSPWHALPRPSHVFSIALRQSGASGRFS